MRNRLKSLVARLNRLLANYAGIRVVRTHRPRVLLPYDRRARFNVGAGADRPDGYVHCDVRPLPGIAIVCRAWELSLFTTEAEEVYSRHTIEHLTLDEVRHTFRCWFTALRIGGRLHVIVPNLDFHIEQWRRATWTDESLQERWSDSRYGLAGFYGWQNECDPTKPDYNVSYWDVHKIGFNPQLLKTLLERAGFVDIETSIVDTVHLHANARKNVNAGERQVSPTLLGIRSDHRARYEFASGMLRLCEHIADAACGVGYGCWIIANQNSKAKVIGFDRDQGALEYAAQYYSHPRIRYHQSELEAEQIDAANLDAMVSFETIEHLSHPEIFLAMIYRTLRLGGMLICSTPNQSTTPFNPRRFPHHVRHYSPAEFSELITSAGFKIEKLLHQDRYGDVNLRDGIQGDFVIVVARR